MSVLFSRMLHEVVETMQVFFVFEFDFDLILSVHAANLNLRIERLRKVFRSTAEEAGLRRLFHRIVLFASRVQQSGERAIRPHEPKAFP